MTPLKGHVSPETAYVVNDYPYGFRLRCRIRYWLEYAPKKGFRLWSQTTNPKRPGEVWNKAKASTYCRFGGAMYLGDNGHVNWTGLTEYDEIDKCVRFNERHGASMPEAGRQFLQLWISRKLAYEQAKLDGKVSITTTIAKVGVYDATGWHDETPAEPRKTTTVIASEFTPAELTAMGETLRTPGNTAAQIARLAPAGLTFDGEASYETPED